MPVSTGELMVELRDVEVRGIVNPVGREATLWCYRLAETASYVAYGHTPHSYAGFLEDKR